MSYVIHRHGSARAELVRHGDCVVVSAWFPDDPEDELSGAVLDFDYQQLDDLIALLVSLKTAQPDELEPEIPPEQHPASSNGVDPEMGR